MIHYIFTNSAFGKMLTIAIALVWLINGLLCKVLNWVPRHQLIVAHILGENHAALLTKIIGFSEILMACWIISGMEVKLCATIQIIVVVIMNVIEFIKTPQLLLFGRINIVVATLFVAIVYCEGFVLPHFVTHNY